MFSKGTAETYNCDAENDDGKSKPLMDEESALEKEDAKNANEEYQGASGHLIDRYGCIEKTNVHKLDDRRQFVFEIE